MQPHEKGVIIMPWRLIVFIVIFGVFLAFITFNLEHKCDISFGFVKFEAVPVFLTVFFSFVLGLLCTLPFIFTAGKRRREKMLKEKIQEIDEASPRNIEGKFSLREKFIGKREGSTSGSTSKSSSNGGSNDAN
jgi:uncharacterized integral membrane protein